MLNSIGKNFAENLLYISQFGSYGTIEWKKDISDIDIGIIVEDMEKLDFSLEYEVEDYFKELYKYENVNVTVVEFDIENQLVRNIICGKTFYSKIDEEELKYKAIYLTRISEKQRAYYDDLMLEKAKEGLEIW